MARSECVGGGTGWGTIEGLRIRVLVLSDPARDDEGIAVARALAARHEAHHLGGKRWFGALEVAKATQTLKPQLLHAVGLEGRAKTARTVALGSGAPLVVSLTTAEIEGAKERLLREVASMAAAVLVDEGRAAEKLRERGINREVYVLATPPTTAEDPLFLSAVEIIYGRVLGEDPERLEDAEHVEGGAHAHDHDHDHGEAPTPRDASGQPLVQLGRKGRS